MKILMFSGSLRKDSLNKKLVAVASGIAVEKLKASVTVIDLQSLNLPVYDGDVESSGMPEGVKKLTELVKEADALVVSSPEYNGSVSGSMKNTVDWLSRSKPMVLEKKPMLLMGATPGPWGTIRSQTALKASLDHLGCFVYPQFMLLPKAGEAFAASGELKDNESVKRLEKLLQKFAEYAAALKGL